MAPTPYIYERQVEYWTSRQMEGFFLDAGFELLTLPITQLTEFRVPADFLYLERTTSKLFGLQFKALYRNGSDRWYLEPRQHQTLSLFDWMYYGLSDMKSASQQRSALHYLRVLPSAFKYRPELSAQLSQRELPPYYRWAAFFDSVCACKLGRRIESVNDLETALWPYNDRGMPREILEIAHEVFLANFKDKRGVRFSSQLNPEAAG
jgi:hypothetical protein